MLHPEDLNQLIRTRRSTFPDQLEAGRPVDEAIIREILINATWAPNHGKEEPWHFTVFAGEGLKKLAEFQSELYKELSGPNFKEGTYKKITDLSSGFKKETKRMPTSTSRLTRKYDRFIWLGFRLKPR